MSVCPPAAQVTELVYTDFGWMDKHAHALADFLEYLVSLILDL